MSDDDQSTPPEGLPKPAELKPEDFKPLSLKKRLDKRGGRSKAVEPTPPPPRSDASQPTSIAHPSPVQQPSAPVVPSKSFRVKEMSAPKADQGSQRAKKTEQAKTERPKEPFFSMVMNCCFRLHVFCDKHIGSMEVLPPWFRTVALITGFGLLWSFRGVIFPVDAGPDEVFKASTLLFTLAKTLVFVPVYYAIGGALVHYALQSAGSHTTYLHSSQVFLYASIPLTIGRLLFLGVAAATTNHETFLRGWTGPHLESVWFLVALALYAWMVFQIAATETELNRVIGGAWAVGIVAMISVSPMLAQTYYFAPRFEEVIAAARADGTLFSGLDEEADESASAAARWLPNEKRVLLYIYRGDFYAVGGDDKRARETWRIASNMMPPGMYGSELATGKILQLNKSPAKALGAYVNALEANASKGADANAAAANLLIDADFVNSLDAQIAQAASGVAVEFAERAFLEEAIDAHHKLLIEALLNDRQMDRLRTELKGFRAGASLGEPFYREVLRVSQKNGDRAFAKLAAERIVKLNSGAIREPAIADLVQ